MKYLQEKDIHYLLERQKRYKKLIKSYQVNDMSMEYNQLKKANEKLIVKINQQALDIEKLNNQLSAKETELKEILVDNKRLRNDVANNNPSTTNNITQQLHDMVSKELQRHLFLIYHLSDVLMILDQNFANREVLDIMDNFETNKTEKTQDSSNVTEESKEISQGQFLSVIQRSENEVKPEIKENKVDKVAEIKPIQKPKHFYFKDLQSYQSAYILPENNKKEIENDLKPNSIFHQKTKTIQKIKQNQLQKATSFDPRLVKKEEPLIEEEKATEETVNYSSLVTDTVETAPVEEIVEDTIKHDHIEKESVPETKSFLKQLWNKVKSFD